MNKQDTDIYLLSAKMNRGRLSTNYRQGITEEARQWALHYGYYTYDQTIDLVLYCVEKNNREMGWNRYDVDGVTWFLLIYCTVAVRSGLVNDFDTIFRASFNKHFHIT